MNQTISSSKLSHHLGDTSTNIPSSNNNLKYNQHKIGLSELQNPITSYSGLSDSVISNTSTNNHYFFNNSVSTNSFINDVVYSNINTSSEDIDNTGIVSGNDRDYTSQLYTQLPIFYDTIKIPTKVATTVKRHIPKALLNKIHSDFDVAVEMCLLYVSQLTGTYFKVKDGSNPDGWKSLKSEYLRDLIPEYKKVRTALEHPLTSGPILECDHIAKVGVKSYHHRLGSSFIGKGIVSYQLKTKEAVNALNTYYSKRHKEGSTNPIVQNLVTAYQTVTLPTDEEVLAEAHRLVEIGYKNRQQKPLRFLNKKPKSYYKHPDQICFVEDALELYGYLKPSLGRILSLGTPESGGRVVDMFTLMPSWIRKLVKINGSMAVDCDFAALHPNIATNLYGGKSTYLTHQQLAEDLSIDIRLIKSEHLSFFNKQLWQMKQSPLYEYYQAKEPQMMLNIIDEKLTSEFKHCVTSRRLFQKEVEIMTDVIAKLNSEGIYVLYVYDALLCHPDQAGRVTELMNSVILNHGVKTIAKCTL
jgi:hypothetical protein